jgi:hypothetical protein
LPRKRLASLLNRLRFRNIVVVFFHPPTHAIQSALSQSIATFNFLGHGHASSPAERVISTSKIHRAVRIEPWQIALSQSALALFVQRLHEAAYPRAVTE